MSSIEINNQYENSRKCKLVSVQLFDVRSRFCNLESFEIRGSVERQLRSGGFPHSRRSATRCNRRSSLGRGAGDARRRRSRRNRRSSEDDGAAGKIINGPDDLSGLKTSGRCRESFFLLETKGKNRGQRSSRHRPFRHSTDGVLSLAPGRQL